MAQFEEFTIAQGTDVSIELECVDKNDAKKDLTAHSVAAKMKKTYTSTSDSDIQAFTAIIATPSTAGIINLSLNNTQTTALRAGRYVYDVELSNVDSSSGNTIIERILEGRIQVTPSVT